MPSRFRRRTTSAPGSTGSLAMDSDGKPLAAVKIVNYRKGGVLERLASPLLCLQHCEESLGDVRFRFIEVFALTHNSRKVDGKD